MSDRIETVVVVTDKGSATFQKVGSSAEKMGTQIDKAGTTGAAGLTKISKAGAVTGAAIAGMVGTLTLASRANAEAEASQARLETAIENTGHSIFEYEDALKAAADAAIQLGFDDEDVADSIAKLTTAMGDTERAIDAVSIVEDIARARKVSLATATQLVIAAEQGRNGALARVGILIDDTATKEEALDALRSQFAGNAEAYAETTGAGYDRMANKAENALQAIGAHLGPMQQLLLILPGLSTGFTGAGAAIGALAPNLTKAGAAAGIMGVALGPVGIAAALLAAGGAALYFSGILDDDLSPSADKALSAVDSLTESLLHYQQIGSDLAILQKETVDDIGYMANAYNSFLTTIGELEDAVTLAEAAENSFAQSHPGDVEGLLKVEQATADAKAALDTYRKSADYATISDEQLSDAAFAANAIIADTGPAADAARSELHRLNEDLEAGGEDAWPKYLEGVMRLAGALPAMNQGMIEAGTETKTTTAAMEEGTAAADAYTAAQERLAQGIGVVGIGFRDMGEAGAAWNTSLADGVRAENDAAAAARNHEAALKQQEGAYYGLRDGIITAAEAQGIFQQTQVGILASQEPFNQQLSEYNQQLGYIDDAEALLNARKEAGIAITKQQQEFLDGANAAQERLQGGTEDATIALGMQAEQYAENMKIGDEMNQGLGTLDDSIQQLIASLHGIPGFVETQVEVDTEEALARTKLVKDQLDALDGKYAHATISVGLVGPGVGYTLPSQEHGGVTPPNPAIPRAQHGMVITGESGPEVSIFPGGTYTVPSPASRLRMGQGGGGDLVINNPTIYVTANTPREFGEGMRAWALSEARS